MTDRTMSLVGEGKVKAEPDTVEVQCVVVGSDAKSLKAAATKQQKAMETLLSSLCGGALSLPRKNISTPRGGYQSGKKMEYDKKQSKHVQVGYEVTQVLSVKAPVEKASELLDVMNEVSEVHDSHFSHSKLDELKEQATLKALDNAQTRAQAYAKQMNVTLGTVQTMSVNGVGVSNRSRGVMRAQSAGFESAPAPELPGGEEEIRATVNVTFLLQ